MTKGKPDLPPFIKSELTTPKVGLSDKVAGLFNAGQPLSVNQIIINLWQRHKIQAKRANMLMLLSRLTRAGVLTTKPHSGLYQLSKKGKAQ